MNQRLLLAAGFSILMTGAFAQQHRTCTTHERYEQAIAADPSLLQRRVQMEAETQSWISARAANPSAQSVITIPVVVHVLYQNATQNISTAQINSQITVLNADYSRSNSDTSNTPAAFKPLAANCELQFCLASTDPNGNPTTGIETRQVSVSQIGNGNNYYSYANGGLSAWDRDKYLNIWVCDIDGGYTLGFAYLPGTAAAAYDGVVIDYRFFGTMGTVSAPYHLGRTATHEVGHWFNLEHIWADEPACNADDYVTDTPQQKGENYGCPSYPQTTQSGGRCNTSDPSSMFMNYMDYSDDNCMNIFTAGQKARMLAAVNGTRSGLLTSNGCGPAGIFAHSGKLAASVNPNPSNGMFEIRLGKPYEQIEVVVTNMIGEIVFRKNVEHTETMSLDLSQLSGGVYVARISAGGASTTTKLVIQ